MIRSLSQVSAPIQQCSGTSSMAWCGWGSSLDRPPLPDALPGHRSPHAHPGALHLGQKSDRARPAAVGQRYDQRRRRPYGLYRQDQPRAADDHLESRRQRLATGTARGRYPSRQSRRFVSDSAQEPVSQGLRGTARSSPRASMLRSKTNQSSSRSPTSRTWSAPIGRSADCCSWARPATARPPRPSLSPVATPRKLRADAVIRFFLVAEILERVKATYGSDEEDASAIELRARRRSILPR